SAPCSAAPSSSRPCSPIRGSARCSTRGSSPTIFHWCRESSCCSSSPWCSPTWRPTCSRLPSIRACAAAETPTDERRHEPAAARLGAGGRHAGDRSVRAAARTFRTRRLGGRALLAALARALARHRRHERRPVERVAVRRPPLGGHRAVGGARRHPDRHADRSKRRLPRRLVVAFYVGPSRTLLVVVLIVSSWARCARELRPAAAALRHADSVVAQRAMGAGEARILVRHVLPALRPLVLAQLARLTHHAVLLEASASFLGLGDPAWAGWGGTLYYANARAAFLGDAWLWWVLPPGLGIALLVTGFALLGVGEPRGAALRAAVVPSAPAPELGPSQLLEVRDLQMGYGDATVLRGLDLAAADGEVVGLLGASGSGKSTLAHALLGLLPPAARIDRGAAWLGGRELLREVEKKGRGGRGRTAEVAWVPQAAMQSLNPVRRIGSQLREVAKLGGERDDVEATTARALEQVGLEASVTRAYPHQLSGGMRQRVVIAMVLCRRPRLLLADEPTSGLDGERAAEVLALLVRLCRERRMVLLLIAHDLALLERHCDRLAVLDGGRVVESGTPAALLAGPRSIAGQVLAEAARPRPRFASMSREAAEPVLELADVDFAYSTGAG